MRCRSLLLASVWVVVLAGCGGGGGGHSDPTVRDANFSITWPARSRAGLETNLTSAQSVRITLNGAGVSNSNVTVNIDRDAARVEGYTQTYTIPQGISPQRLTSATATFYAQPSQGGAVVGTATAPASLINGTVEFGTITLSGTITEVVATSANLTVGDGPTQLLFTAKDAGGQTVAVSAGSATWSLVDGSEGVINLTPDGKATPLTNGSAYVRVTVDGVTSMDSQVQVAAVGAPIYAFLVAKEGQLIEPSFPAVEGNKFEVNGDKDIVVTKLGYEAARGTQSGGITAIFDENGTILASAEISSADELKNGYYYKEITPITLSHGSQYYIGSLHGTGAAGAYLWQTQAAATPAFVVDLGTCAKFSSTIEGGSWSTPGSPRHYVGNFQAYQTN